jgi:hypothetical protein
MEVTSFIISKSPFVIIPTFAVIFTFTASLSNLQNQQTNQYFQNPLFIGK